MNKDKIIEGISHELGLQFASLIRPDILEDLSQRIYDKIKPDLCPKDLVNYHEVVKIVEQERFDSPKMVMPLAETKLEKALNKIRDGLRTLKKS